MDEMIEFLHKGPLSPIKRWGTKFSLWPVHLVTACCGVELAHGYAAGYDGERLGSLNFGISRQTNLIIVEGAITRKMARVLKMTYEQMPDPKFVIVMGACGLRGGLFWNGYHMVNPADIVPVKYFIPGCPPTPEGMLRAIRALQEEIISGKWDDTIKFKPIAFEEVKKRVKKIPPQPPKRRMKNVAIIVDRDRSYRWEEGRVFVEKIREHFGDLVSKVVVTAKNRICASFEADRVREVMEKAKEFGFDHVKILNVIDVPHLRKFIIEYHLSSYSNKELMKLIVNFKTEISREEAKIKSVADIFPSVDYMEREMHELFGVVFEGNEWMGRNFLLAPDTPKYPLRKDFELEEDVYVGGE